MTDTPNPLKGNPHYDLAYDRVVAAAATSEAGDEQVAQTEALMAQTEATLALAFEVRTANLINVLRAQADMAQSNMTPSGGAGDDLNSRLGLEN